MKRVWVLMIAGLGLLGAGCASEDNLLTVDGYEISRGEAADIVGEIIVHPTGAALDALTPEIVQVDQANRLVSYGQARAAMQAQGAELTEDDRLNAAALIQAQGLQGITELELAPILALGYSVAGLPIPSGTTDERAAQINADVPALQQALGQVLNAAPVVTDVDPALGVWRDDVPPAGLILPPTLDLTEQQ